jgi:hypothetical protein
MKTLKFVLLFNLFVYSVILMTLTMSALFAYQIDFDSFEDLLLRYHKALPLIFLIVNSALLLIRVSEIVTAWSWKFVKNLVFNGKYYKKLANSSDLSFSGSI